MSERKVEIVQNNIEKQNTYRRLMGRYKKAIREGFYFDALLIAYATIEDRLRSFLYYMGAIRRFEDLNLNVGATKKQIRSIYFGSEEAAHNQRIDINKISNKIRIIRTTLDWSMTCEEQPKDPYLAVMKSEYEGCLDIGGMIEVLESVEEWNQFRNEIIHGLLNKNLEDVVEKISERVEEGMEYARFIDSQIKCLKKNNEIRKQCRIKY